jgi:hypothetical protein
MYFIRYDRSLDRARAPCVETSQAAALESEASASDGVRASPMVIQYPLKSLALAALLVGCGDPGSEPADESLPTSSERGTFALDIVHEDGTFRRGANSFVVHAADHAGHPASVTRVTAQMPGHDHGITPPRIDCAGGACRVSDLLLTMPGRWQITLQFSGDGAQDDALLAPVLR